MLFLLRVQGPQFSSCVQGLFFFPGGQHKESGTIYLAMWTLFLFCNQNAEGELSPVLVSGSLLCHCAWTRVCSSRLVAFALFLPVSVSEPRVLPQNKPSGPCSMPPTRSLLGSPWVGLCVRACVHVSWLHSVPFACHTVVWLLTK